MLRLVIGADDVANTHKLTRMMVDEAAACPSKKFIAIVPEQATLQMQQRAVRLHPSHACMNIDVVSFDRLAEVVLAKLGRSSAQVLDDTGKALIMRRVLSRCADSLSIYKNKARMEGFTEEAKSMITEFKQYGVTLSSLAAMKDAAERDGNIRLSAKLSDLYTIYSSFNSAIAEKYITSEEVLDVFASAIPDSDFFDGADVFLDGFTGFTPVQYKITGCLMRTCENITASATIEPSKLNRDCADHEMFFMSNQIYFKLKDMARANGIQVSEDIVCPGEKRSTGLCIHPAASLSDEVTFAAAEIVSLVKNDKARFNEIAVLAPEPDLYRRRIIKTFSDASVPVFIDHRSEIPGNTLVRFILSAVEMAADNMSYESVFSFLKTGLCNLTEDELSMLENYCLEFNIRGRHAWENDFYANRRLRENTYVWDIDEINRIRKLAMTGCTRFLKTAGAGRHRAVIFIKAIRLLLSDSSAEERIADLSERIRKNGDAALALQYGQIYSFTDSLLEKMELLIGNDELTLKEFAEVFQSGADEIRIAVIPPAVDVVTAGNFVRTRLGDIKYMFVLGVNDGSLPFVGGSRGLFTEREREFLRRTYDLAPTRHEDLYNQSFYLYLGFNRPTKRLYLSWPRLSDSGEELRPSSIIEDPGSIMRSYTLQEPGSGPDDILWPELEKHRTALALSALAAGRELSDQKIIGYFARTEPVLIKKLILAAFYTNACTPLDEQVALDLYGGVLKGSVSRFESFYECPYRHFLSYGMGLEERREYRVEASDLGTVYHETLEKYSKALKERGLTFRSIDDEESHAITDECVWEAVSEMENDALESSARYEFLKKRIAEISRKTTDVLREQVKAGLFEPEAYELSFEDSMTEDVRFRGKIDRVDLYDSGDIFVKIIDYKSGSKKFEIKDIYSGIQLQLIAYMDEALRLVRNAHPDRAVRPGGVYYYLINDRYIRSEEDLEDKFKMSGVTSSEEGIAQAVDKNLLINGKSSIIPVTFSPRGRSMSASDEEFDSMIAFVRKKVSYAADSIRSGNVELAPYKDGSHTGCSYCAYHDICRFEAGSFGTDWRKPSGLSVSEMEDEIYGRT